MSAKQPDRPNLKLDNQIQTKLYDAMITITAILPMLKDDQRIELVELLLDGYCTDCGSKLAVSTYNNVPMPCYCTMDE